MKETRTAKAMTCYISAVEITDPRYHRSHVIVHRPDGFYLAEFRTMEQLAEFAKMLGFTYTVRRQEESKMYGRYTEYDIDRKFVDEYGGGFWSANDLPAEVEPFQALSNGYIVTCYFVNDGETITIYRPNPHSRLYDPMSLFERMGFVKRHGLY